MGRQAGLCLVAAMLLVGCGRSYLDEPGRADVVSGEGGPLQQGDSSPTGEDGSVSGMDASVGDAPSFGFDATDDAPGPAPYDAGASCSSTCAGCCEGTVCYPGTSDPVACGLQGRACVTCGEGFECLKGVCARSQPNCGPSNCGGCCVRPGDVCADGLSPFACGTGGQACTGCTHNGKGGSCDSVDAGGGVCNGAQACNLANCSSGCCNGDVCEFGTSDTACGGLASACVVCPAGQSCVDNTCQSPPFCNAQNCGTCCDGNQCVAGDTDQACGEQSEPCQDCASRGMVCQNHQCVPGCSPSNCTGCCDGNVCALGDQDLACGSGGASCEDCTQFHGTCVMNACSF